MSVERRLVDALSAFESVEPAPDLFRRVERSVADDLARRGRVVRWIAGIVAVVSALLLGVVAVSSVSTAGTLVAPGWVIVAAESIVLAVVVLAFGPLIRRFGTVFVEDVFGGVTGRLGGAFIRLLDVAYYLIFTGYVIVTSPVSGLDRLLPVTAMLESSLPRLGGVLLLMGVIHAVTLSVLPVVGLIHASTVRARRRALAPEVLPATPGAALAERVVRIILWTAGSLVALLVLATVLRILVVILSGTGE